MAKELGQNPIENATAPQSPVPTTAVPVYGKDGRLTYDSLRGITAAGGSVVLGGKVVTAANLPSELDYASAGGDAGAKESAQRTMEGEIARLQGELARARATPPTPSQGETKTNDPTGDDRVLHGHKLSVYRRQAGDKTGDDRIAALMKVEGIGKSRAEEIAAALDEK